MKAKRKKYRRLFVATFFDAGRLLPSSSSISLHSISDLSEVFLNPNAEMSVICRYEMICVEIALLYTIWLDIYTQAEPKSIKQPSFRRIWPLKRFRVNPSTLQLPGCKLTCHKHPWPVPPNAGGMNGNLEVRSNSSLSKLKFLVPPIWKQTNHLANLTLYVQDTNVEASTPPSLRCNLASSVESSKLMGWILNSMMQIQNPSIKHMFVGNLL